VPNRPRPPVDASGHDGGTLRRRALGARGPLRVVLEHREQNPELVLRDDRGVAEVLRVHDPALARVLALLREEAPSALSRVHVRDEAGLDLEVRSGVASRPQAQALAVVLLAATPAAVHAVVTAHDGDPAEWVLGR
jgi:hypothetical protein